MEERNYYRNTSVKEENKEPEKQKSSFKNLMLFQFVVAATVLSLMLLCKVIYNDGYLGVKAVFSNSGAAKTKINSLFSQGANALESSEVFSRFFTEEEEKETVLIEKNSPMTEVGIYEQTYTLQGASPVYGGIITDGFGIRQDPFTNETAKHLGVDIGVNLGTGVVSVYDGVVKEVGADEILGNYIVINHENNLQTKYAHLLCPLVAVGQTVLKGEQIALSGNSGRSTGPHLHFAVLENGKYENPLYYVEIEN